MKFSVLTVLLSTTLALAAPTRRDTVLSDIQVLQFALTVEHIENAFYTGALARFDDAAFKRAGLPSWVRGRFVQLAAHEAEHVQRLTKLLGNQAVAPCKYSFPYTDPISFAANSAIFEGVGVSAYIGATSHLSNNAYSTIAGSILSIEARNQAWVNGAVNKQQPWSGSEDTPLGFNQVFSIASGFIVKDSCPKTNPTLPVKAFPALTASPANAHSGTEVTYEFTAASPSQTYYAAYFYGLDVTRVKLSNKKAKIPAGLLGTYYTIITTAAEGNVTDENTVAGPLISVANFPA